MPHNKTPWNPSRKATALVTNPLPLPTCCPNCGGTVGLVSNKVIYGREYGNGVVALQAATAFVILARRAGIFE